MRLALALVVRNKFLTTSGRLLYDSPRYASASLAKASGEASLRIQDSSINLSLGAMPMPRDPTSASASPEEDTINVDMPLNLEVARMQHISMASVSFLMGRPDVPIGQPTSRSDLDDCSPQRPLVVQPEERTSSELIALWPLVCVSQVD